MKSTQLVDELEEDEILVSFDIELYFPSVPVDQPLRHKTYLELTEICMQQNCFKLRGKCYRQTSGTAMGNPLPPFLCNVFMNKLQANMKEEAIFPRVWKRYVDDVLAIVKVNRLDEVFAFINSIYAAP